MKYLQSFSNFGSTLDLVAPGSQIITCGLDNTYKTVSGTSVSAPFVSAAASIILSFNNYNSEELKQVLKTTCKI
ncbi:MAG: S8 family serine peptidase [Ignavibacteriales bacterium]|nr:S8 family serine peptidase [Ignavibacteriales bacterium]